MYGPNSWLQLYQADGRARGDRTGKLKLMLLEYDMNARVTGCATSMDPSRHWNAVWRHLLAEDVLEEIVRDAVLDDCYSDHAPFY